MDASIGSLLDEYSIYLALVVLYGYIFHFWYRVGKSNLLTVLFIFMNIMFVITYFVKIDQLKLNIDIVAPLQILSMFLMLGVSCYKSYKKKK